MKRKPLLPALLLISSLAVGQVSTSVNIENTDGTYHIKITKDEDGKKTTLDKTYNSLAELKNDPELAAYNLQLFAGPGKDEEVMVFSTDSAIAEGAEHHHKIKTWVDNDGQKHVVVNGGKIDTRILDKVDGPTIIITKDGEKITIKTNGDGGEETESLVVSGQGDEDEYIFKLRNSDAAGKKVIMLEFTDEESDQHTVNVELLQHQVEIADVAGDEFKNLPGTEAKELRVEELNYYPNPNHGKFTLAFKAGKKPLTINITGLDGKTVYHETLAEFSGSYHKRIDLTKQAQGIYLLQVRQGNRTLNKKIIIQ